LDEGGGLLGCFELSRAGGGVHSVVGEGQKGTGETGWLAGTGGRRAAAGPEAGAPGGRREGGREGGRGQGGGRQGRRKRARGSGGLEEG